MANWLVDRGCIYLFLRLFLDILLRFGGVNIISIVLKYALDVHKSLGNVAATKNSKNSNDEQEA